MKPARIRSFFFSAGLFLSITGIIFGLRQQNTLELNLKHAMTHQIISRFQFHFMDLALLREQFLLSGGENVSESEHHFVQEIIWYLQQLRSIDAESQEFRETMDRLLTQYNDYERKYLAAAASTAKSDMQQIKSAIKALTVSISSILKITEHLHSTTPNAKLSSGDVPWFFFSFAGIFLLTLSLFIRHKQIVPEHQSSPSENTPELSSFIAGLAHEIKNPLAGVQANLELMAMDQNSQELDLAIRECRRLYRMLENYVDFLRPGIWNEAEIDIDAMKKEVTGLFFREISDKKIHLDFSLLPKVKADPTRFRQIWINLFQNAVRVSPENGHIETKMSMERGFLIFQVTDEGPGVPPGMEKKIFYPFFSLKGGGSGLGLFICANITKDRSGSIRYTREKNKTVFTASLKT